MLKNTCDQMLQFPPREMMMDQSRWKPHVEIAPNCPRCASPNTKFCYYNNYSLSQPRYFCKGCRRYWTKGGSLRNVPVGGGCRKNRRSRPARLALSEAHRMGLGYLRDIPSPTRSSSGSVNMSPGGSVGPSEIDLADVYAKFLNNENSEEKQFGSEDSSSGTSCGSLEMAPGSFDVNTNQMDNFMMMECQIPSEYIQEACLNNELPGDFVGEEDIQDFVCQYPNLYGLQELIDDELPQDISWKDDNNLSSFSWQQGYEHVSYNDQVKIATNIVTEDWSSMDPSSYGIFAGP